MDDTKTWVKGELGMKARFKCMFQQESMYDVEFIVNGEKVGAHRLVLAISSPVFNEMFTTETGNDGKSTIELVDFSSVVAFREFIKFIYMEEANITMENVFPLLYLARHYVTPTLEAICSSFVKDRVGPDNVAKTLDFSLKLSLQDIELACKAIMCRDARKIINAKSFFHISHETLRYFLGLDEIQLQESELVLAVIRWCQEEVSRKPQTPETPRPTLRNVLGEALYLLRFPCMDEAIFATEVAYSGLLSLKEVRDVYSYFAYKRMKQTGVSDEAVKKLEQHVCKIPFPVEDRRFNHTYLDEKMPMT